MADPTFLVVGAQKCGTTWLSKTLDQHPDVFVLPKKELHFFSNRLNYAHGVEWYRQQFAGHSGEKAIGEATPNYFWTSTDEREIEENNLNRDIPGLVHKHYPDIKLILCLRNPVERAISSYYHNISVRRVDPASHIMDVGHKYGIISMGFYYTHLRAWQQYFGIEQFLIFIYEYGICQNKERTLAQCHRFLGVVDRLQPVELQKRYNTRSGHLYMYLNSYSPKLARILFARFPRLRRVNFPRISVTDEDRRALREIYADENERLASHIGRDLAIWDIGTQSKTS